LDNRSAPFVFIGFQEGVKGAKVLHPLKMRPTFSRDVVFDEELLGLPDATPDTFPAEDEEAQVDALLNTTEIDTSASLH
jgi:hypothetical protein